jgi:hypothetical protein
MSLAGTFGVITTWAADVIDGVAGYNKVYTYQRKIRTTDQLVTDFGTGANNSQSEPIIKGWMVGASRREVMDRQRDSVIWAYGVDYLCLWSLEDSGANRADFVTHVETVADALMATARPAALAMIDGSMNEICGPVQIGDIYTVVFPIDSGRIHYRADMTQTLRLRQSIRS